MKDYPNEEALRKAHRIYLDAMRGFIHRCLKKVQGTTPTELIMRALDCELSDDIEVKIEVNNIPYLIREYWGNCFHREFDRHYDARSAAGLIKDGRNFWAHPGIEDVDSESTRMHLSLVAEALGEINKPEAKEAVETIRDQLFSDEPEEHPLEAENAALKENLADITKQLEAAKAEKTELEKQVKTTSDRLEEVESERIACDERLATISFQLKTAVAGRTVAEERLSDISNRLEDVEIEKTELEKRLKATSDRLKDVEKENAAYQKRVETISDQLETEKTKYEKVLKAASKEPLPLNPNTPDSFTFQGTIFTKHLDEYHVPEDDISQSFWHYWHSKGREGKQEMRDAGWSIERIDGDWEITISPEDFRAWIEYEVTKLNNLFNSPQNEEPSTQPTRPSYERTSLPTVKEMAQPALEIFADRKEHRRIEMINHLTEYFLLDDDERHYLSKTGQVEKHLMNEGLIERTRTGYYRITDRGYKVVEIPF